MHRTFIAWLPILGFAALQLIPETYWCGPIEPGGREFACGLAYAHTRLRAAVDIFQVMSAVSVCATGWHAYTKRLSKWGVAGLLCSGLLLAFAAWANIFFGGDDSP
jgi:hypothetical protein